MRRTHDGAGVPRRRPTLAGLLACSILAASAVAAAAGQASSPAEQVHPHGEGRAHESDAATGQPPHYLTLNVEVSDEAIQPSAVFVPAGQPVQLVLRNRGTTEHHYRVEGLRPDDLVWVAQGPAEGPGASADEHDHHDRHFVSLREPSPAGVRPSGSEVHAYVSGRAGVDVVMFSATETGTFLVRCDLHPEKTARLVVFDGAEGVDALTWSWLVLGGLLLGVGSVGWLVWKEGFSSSAQA